MKTKSTVEILSWHNGELTVKVIGDIGLQEMSKYIQYRLRLSETKPQVELQLGDKCKKRTTGKNSQNTKLHGILRQIANATGNGVDMVKYVVKQKAMNELGYPTMKNANGDIVWNTLLNEPFAQSEADCTTKDERLLIDAAYMLAAENQIFVED